MTGISWSATGAGFETFRLLISPAKPTVSKDAGMGLPTSAGVPVESIQGSFADDLPGKRVMLTATWSLQRARHGEQPYWALAALAAILGQVGLPGGGVAFGYGSINAQGNPLLSHPAPTVFQVTHPIRQRAPSPVCPHRTTCCLAPRHRVPLHGRNPNLSRTQG